MKHEPIVTRRRLGAGAIKGSRVRYGTNVTCTCRKWSAFSNDKTLSRGGQKWAERVHAEQHLPKTTVEGDIMILKVMIEIGQRRLAEAIEEGLVSFIESHSKKLADLVAQLVHDIKVQAGAELAAMNEES